MSGARSYGLKPTVTEAWVGHGRRSRRRVGPSAPSLRAGRRIATGDCHFSIKWALALTGTYPLSSPDTYRNLHLGGASKNYCLLRLPPTTQSQPTNHHNTYILTTNTMVPRQLAASSNPPNGEYIAHLQVLDHSPHFNIFILWGKWPINIH